MQIIRTVVLSVLSCCVPLYGSSAFANEQWVLPQGISAPLQVSQVPAGGQLPRELPQETFNAFFQPRQVGEANFYQDSVLELYDRPENGDFEVEVVYSLALQLPAKLLDGPTWDWVDYERLAEFRAADFSLWGLAPNCIAECTVAAFALDLDEFQAIATRTETTADDDFFALLQAYYPDASIIDRRPWGWPAFFERTWDYGGYSLLGGGQHLKLLQQIDQFQQQQATYLLNSPFTVFAEQVQGMRHRLLRDILFVSDCSGLEQGAIAAELTQILDTVSLNQAERTALVQRLDAFQTSAPDIQTDCQELGECTCVGG